MACETVGQWIVLRAPPLRNQTRYQCITPSLLSRNTPPDLHRILPQKRDKMLLRANPTSYHQRLTEGWIVSHLIVACAWPPWRGNTPSEWKGLLCLRWESQKANEEDKLAVASNLLSSPAAMAADEPARVMRTNTTVALRVVVRPAVKAETDGVRKARDHKENMAHDRDRGDEEERVLQLWKRPMSTRDRGMATRSGW